ncbi:MAG: DUF971 domain-containing protein [Planctomycetes bacterium]|nr:DUF971 domain-containing protein [Planctomycetota bacterium]
MASTQPASIELDVHKELKIAWSDDHASVYPLDYLRRNCPCAGCQTQRKEAEEAKKNPRANPFKVLTGPVLKQVEALNVEAVGNYALRFDWTDQHNTGIYTFGYLRSLCPCGQCRAKT